MPFAIGELATYARDAVVAAGTGDTKAQAFSRALNLSGFNEVLRGREAVAATPAVAIAPNLNAARGREDPPRSYTDPELVELLVAHLYGLGVTDIAIVGSRSSGDPRPVADIAADLGYSGNGYRVEDLSADTVDFDYGGILGMHPAGRAWAEAGFRISFAKNKTHWALLYAGTMANVLGCLPEADKLRRYTGPEHELTDCCRTVLEAMPVHFGLVDAWDSTDGTGLPRLRRRARRTGAVLASPNVFALDWFVGEMMDVDPALNPMLQEAMHRWGRIELDRRGNLTPWDPWRNASLGAAALSSSLPRPLMRALGKEVAWIGR